MTDLVRRVAATINIPFTVGGGISDVDDIRPLLESGADKISINTPALERPALIGELAQAFGVPAFPVDTHIHRLAQRWRLTGGKNVERTEADLKKLFAEAREAARALLR